MSLKNLKILVVGGAGYVGCAACAYLIDRGCKVWVLDDLSEGHRELLLGEGFTHARAGDRAKVLPLLREHQFDCVMHFAAKALVSESVKKPALYFENNVDQTRALLEMMIETGTRNFIFSSTCATFGDPGDTPMDENCPQKPINPYGESKLRAEMLMRDFATHKGLRVVALRYFNAAGAEPGLRVGEWHDPETHLIPRIFRAAHKKGAVEIFGTDYATPDGTCLRDYIHISDLATAHVAAMSRLLAQGPSAPGSFEAFNLGTETGFSVREVIRIFEEVSGQKLEVIERARRPGDPPKLVGQSALAKRELGFKITGAAPGDPTGPLRHILSSAWAWETKRRSIMKRALFMDRDGTVNIDPGYLSDPKQVELIAGVPEALSRLRKAGFSLVVISNQSGVGRGLIRSEDVPAINARFEAILGGHDVSMDRYAYCYHMPADACDCRKPNPTLIFQSARELGIDITRSYMVGDKPVDLGAGRAADCGAVALVRTGYGRETEAALKPGDTDFIGDSLPQVVEWILARENANS
ncbi:UDP-glucose 4-epimerase GalE [Bdellovibrionota bacterium FG-2]